VDITPPHAGAVHDGLPGNPEIDYQQGTDLKAYWDQFFDRESGVLFYQYIVGTTRGVMTTVTYKINIVELIVDFKYQNKTMSDRRTHKD
jgi:hypothetical protein